MTIDDLISNKICRNLQHNCTRRAPSVSTNYSFETDRACEENTAFIFYTLTFYLATDKTADSWLHFRGTILPLQHFFFFNAPWPEPTPPLLVSTHKISQICRLHFVFLSLIRGKVFSLTLGLFRTAKALPYQGNGPTTISVPHFADLISYSFYFKPPQGSSRSS